MQELLLKIKMLVLQVTMLRRKLIYKLALESIGKDASPYDRVDDIVGCAESVTEILKAAGAFPKITVGTYTLWQELLRAKHWAPTTNPQPGDIILSPTGTGNGSIRGHVGIIGNNKVVMSNDSYSGQWRTHYDIDSWKFRYHNLGGMPVYYFTYYYGYRK